MRNERNRNVYQRDRRFCFHFKGVSYFLTGIEIAVIKNYFITEVRLHGKQHCKCIWLHKGVNRGTVSRNGLPKVRRVRRSKFTSICTLFTYQDKKKRAKIYQDRVLRKMARTIVNTRKIEVIPSYARKNKSAHGLPRQHTCFCLKCL